jgi:hypothetical protein
MLGSATSTSRRLCARQRETGTFRGADGDMSDAGAISRSNVNSFHQRRPAIAVVLVGSIRLARSLDVSILRD